MDQLRNHRPPFTTPPMEELCLDIGEENELHFYGAPLGQAVSRVETHTHPTPGLPTGRCSACRWIDVSLFSFRHLVNPPRGWIDRWEFPSSMTGKDKPDDLDNQPVWYMLVLVGETVIPAETTRFTFVITKFPFELIELGTRHEGDRHFIPVPTARVFAQAASVDSAIRDAYVNRAVT